MATSLENQYIDESYQKVVQISGSVIADGTGSVITDLDITASHAVSASYAVSASVEIIKEVSSSYADVAGIADAVSGSNVVGSVANANTASYVGAANVDGKVAEANVADLANLVYGENVLGPVTSSISASYAATASLLLGSVVSASFASNASTATSASHAVRADIASEATSSLTATSSSFATQAGNSSTSVTASHANNATSASRAVTAASADTATSSTTATSASHAVQADSALSADSATTASYVETAQTASFVTGSNVIGTVANATSSSHAVQADHSDTTQEVIINVKNTSGGILAKGTPVYATGVTGENINVSPADYSSTATMPAIAVTQEQIAINATGEATVSGRIVGVNTDGFTAGRNIYVNGNGTFQDSRPTGSGILVQNIGVVGKVDATDGEIVIQGSGRSNDLPNIAENFVWLGNSNGVASAVNSGSLKVDNAYTASIATSASHAVRADVADDLASTARINITDITASNASFTSASIGYLKTVTGSATIIGDEYIILNADSPTQRYAGVKVYDSGSGLTGSFEWDSVDDNWMQVATDGTSAGFLTAISGSKGSEAYPTNNRLIKGTGNHTVKDSSITDDGSTVSTSIPVYITHNSTADEALNITTTEDSSAAGPIIELKRNSSSPADGDYLGQLKFQGENDADQQVLYAKITGKTSDVRDTTEDGLLEFAVKSDGSNSIIARINKNGISMVNGTLDGSASYATTAGFADDANIDSGSWDGIFTGSASMTGSLTVNGDSQFNFKTAPNFTYKDIITFPTFTKSASPGNGLSVGYNAFRYFNIPVAGAVNNTFLLGQGSDANFTDYGSYLNVGNSRSDLYLLASGSAADAKKTATISVLDNSDSTYEGNAVARYYGTTIEIGLYNSRDILVGNGFFGGTGYDTRTINVASEKMYIGAAPGQTMDWAESNDLAYSGNPTKDIEFWYTGSATFHQTGSVVGPAIVVSGSVASHVKDLTISSTTASIDCNTGDVFTLTLANNANTHLVATNINPGQVVTVKVKNNATAAGTLSFNSEFAFAEGTAPTVTATTNAEDILTFQSFDSSKLYGTSVLNLS